jgi:cellulose synthase/poly-beta-1,6-N-acetylglucosamine synthase-like glycosyltransferase/HEAT repeat protein
MRKARIAKGLLRAEFPKAVASGTLSAAAKRDWNAFFEAYIELRQSIRGQPGLDAAIRAEAAARRYDFALTRVLLRGRPDARAEAAFKLGYIGTDASKRALSLALLKERRRSVKLAIAHALAVTGDASVIPNLIDSLRGEPDDYQASLRAIIVGFGDDFAAYLPMLQDRREREICLLVLRFASLSPSHSLEAYASQMVGHGHPSVREAAWKCLFGTYRHAIDFRDYVRSEEPTLRALAIDALGNAPNEESLDVAIALLEDYPAEAQSALGNLAGSSPRLFASLNARLQAERKPGVRAAIIAALASRVEFFLSHLAEDDSGAFGAILDHTLASGNVSGVINFLNRNRDAELEEAILARVAERLREHPLEARDFRIYLDRGMLGRLGLEPLSFDPKDRGERKERVPPLPLALGMALALIAPPVAYLAATGILGPSGLPGASLPLYASAYLSCFAWYALASNAIALALLVISWLDAKSQARRRRAKPESFLFREGMLPSVSIVAPAYNEQASIVESVRSLLSLRYPDYEVIVVNDGSTDATLRAVVDAFKLERRDVPIKQELATRPVRGVYLNPEVPGLIVIDKANGGKADSLNAGINAAGKRYFAGIDSDSLLERDALLEIFSRFVDIDEEVVASGGNIFPVNGCLVDRGKLVRVEAPRRWLPRLQAVEYLRAFMNARVGWARLKSLLIISGAFGVFERARVLQTRGYMTSGEALDKDTVGEDMELVVRLSRMMRERREPFAVQYACAANCWTEVPSTFKVLSRQRDRWQRGLLDILIYHRKAAFNPRYGAMGLIAFPYYIIFEALGPWLEAQALLLTPFAFAAFPQGLYALAASLVASALLGVALSISSFAVSEAGRKSYGAKDKFRLLAASIAENAGFRQWASLVRVSGYVNALRGKTGWGRMTRTGLGAAASKAGGGT